MQITVNGQRVTVSDNFAQMSPEEQAATVDYIASQLGQQQPGPRIENLPASGPTISVGGQQIPMADYMAMPAEQRQALQTQIARTTGHVPQPLGGGLLDSAVQGTTFGWADELRSVAQGANAAMTGGDYQATANMDLNQSRANLENARQQNPIGSLAAEIAGAIPTSIALGGGAAASGAGLGARMLTGMGVGAAQGAVYGAGASDGNDMAQGAAIGALTGGAGGLLMPAAATGVGAAYRNIANRLASGTAARTAGTTPQAARFLTETLAADDSLSPQGLARMRAAGGEAMLADAGPSARNALDLAIQGSGGAGRIAREAIDARVGRDAQALQNALDAALGSPQGVNTLRTGIRESTRGARSSAYDAAYAQPIDYSSPAGRNLESLLSRLSQSDIDRANNLMRMEGFQSQQILADVAEDGTVTYLRQPDVRQIDYITRALNDRAQANAGLGSLGGTTNEGRIFGNLSSEMRDTLRGAVPEYDAALSTGADAIRRSQAVEFGSDLLRRNIPQDDVANWVLRATGPEREAAQQGVRSYIDDMLANVTRTVQDGDMPAREAIAALRVLSSRANRNKLTALLGTDDASRLIGEIDRITKSFELRASVADNSKTFQRQEMNRRLTDTTQPSGPLETLMRGEPVNAAKVAIQTMTGRTSDRALAQRDAILQSVARMLTDQSGQAVSTMQALRFLNGSMGANDAVFTGLARGGQQVGTAAALPMIGQF